MLKQVLDQSITALKTIDSFIDDADNKVFRGELGKINVVKSEGCIVMPEFKPPASFGMTDDVKEKELHFSPNYFVMAAKRKTLEEAENDVMELVLKVITKIHETVFQIDQTGGNFKYCNLELTDIEWLERSASLCVIALEFTVKLQV